MVKYNLHALFNIVFGRKAHTVQAKNYLGFLLSP